MARTIASLSQIKGCQNIMSLLVLVLVLVLLLLLQQP
jgi:hypothetical protein